MKWYTTRPWAKPDPIGYVGSEEIVSPGGPISIGLIGVKVIDHLRIARALQPLCESPIELELGIWLVRLLAGHDIISIPQFHWKRWRMDFALKREDTPLLFIECDGRDFHSTPEQIKNDREKDAAAARAEITLMRFSGSEIYNDAYHCARVAVAEALFRK